MFTSVELAPEEPVALAENAEPAVKPRPARATMAIARREFSLILRARLSRGMLALLVVVAWLPPVLLALRAGSIGLASFGETVALALAFGEIALPLIGLLGGADLLAGEAEDNTLAMLVALPISRASVFAGKLIARCATLAAAYLMAFGSAAIAIALSHGIEGLADYAILAGAGLALTIACGGIGVALGRPGAGRLRAFGAALLAWIVMVFALDAAILAAVVALAPPAPEQVGAHGYGENAAQMEMMKLHEMDYEPGQHRAGAAGESASAAQWLMALDPVDLFRFTVLSGAPILHERAKMGLGDGAPGWFLLLGAWLAWIALPLGYALRRFRRTDLR
jgi:ABC-type transport system involved in multi-copper enzyme maturation permease subunit